MGKSMFKLGGIINKLNRKTIIITIKQIKYNWLQTQLINIRSYCR